LDLLKDAPPRSGYFLDQLGDLDRLPAWLTEQDLDFFTAEFERTGFRGGLNWYRNQDRNWELSAPFQGRKVEQPALFVSGDRDLVRMTPEFETEMRKVVPNLAKVVTLPDVGHWTQQESPEQTNAALLRFLDGLDWRERR
jgi:pimeloyl-ACP methyl ester carboxylesterase